MQNRERAMFWKKWMGRPNSRAGYATILKVRDNDNATISSSMRDQKKCEKYLDLGV